MATIAFQVVTTADGTINRSKTITEAAATRLIAAYQQQANDAIGGTATRTQVWNYILSKTVERWIADVRASEATAAAMAVTDITIT